MILNIGKYFIDVPRDEIPAVTAPAGLMRDKGYIPLLRNVFQSKAPSATIDIGANVGIFGFILSTVAPIGPYFCVEWRTEYLSYLKSNIAKLHSASTFIEALPYSPVTEHAPTEGSQELLGRVEISAAKAINRSSPGFVTIRTIVKSVGATVSILRIDLQASNHGVVDEFIELPEAQECLIVAKVSDSQGKSNSLSTNAMLSRLAEKRYSAAVFSDQGLPIVFLEHTNLGSATDLLRFQELNGSYGTSPFCCSDLFLFPPALKDVWRDTAEGYRMGTIW